jgi:hypothetical protein
MGASVYKYFDKNSILIYVGMTGRGSRRNAEHNKTKDWWPLVASQEVEHFDTREQASAREVGLISELSPPFNRQHNKHSPDALLAAYLSVSERDTNAPTKPKQLLTARGGKLGLSYLGDFTFSASPSDEPLIQIMRGERPPVVREGQQIGCVRDIWFQGRSARVSLSIRKEYKPLVDLSAGAVMRVSEVSQKPFQPRLRCVTLFPVRG